MLGPFDDELEEVWRTSERLTQELEDQEKAQKAATKAQKAATKGKSSQESSQGPGGKGAQKTQQRSGGTEWTAGDSAPPIAESADRPGDPILRRTHADTWEGLNEAEKAVATDKYRDALREAGKAGLELSDAQEEIAASGLSLGGTSQGWLYVWPERT